MASKSKSDVKTKKSDSQSDKNEEKIEKPKKKGGLFKIILILLILFILAATGFAAGIYLKFIDIQALGEKWKMNEYPVIGKYFSEPKTNFEPVELEAQNPVVSPQNLNGAPTVAPIVQPEALLPEKRIIDDAELQKQAKIKQQEEAKRISKVAKLYDEMAPEAAAPILSKMDDDTVLLILSKMQGEQVAKIMPLFDTRRAAVLSQSMLRGKSTN